MMVTSTAHLADGTPMTPTARRLLPTARLDAAVTEALPATGVAGAVVGVWRCHDAYTRAFGVADTATGEPMRTDVHHRIGSVTKTFTVTAVLQLVDDGEIRLDDSVADYVDGVPGGDRITVRHLARMQSGLPNYSTSTAFAAQLFADPQRHFCPRELLDIAFARPVSFAPGDDFEYSNTNTVLLGIIVEEVGGLPLADHVRTRITDPLGLRHTGFPVGTEFEDPHAQGYLKVGDDEAVTTDWNPSWAGAAGAMTSTLDDMRAWAAALGAGALLTPETHRQRLETVSLPTLPPHYGYGLGLFDLAGWVGHNGSLPGYQTVVARLADGPTTMVVLLNGSAATPDGDPSTVVANAITRVISPDHVYTLG